VRWTKEEGEAVGGRGIGPLVAGLRSEVSRKSRRRFEERVVFKAEIDLVESLGFDLYAYFHVKSEGVESDQLADLVGTSLEKIGAASLREGKSSPGSTL
jgi:hypothetical protein